MERLLEKQASIALRVTFFVLVQHAKIKIIDSQLKKPLIYLTMFSIIVVYFNLIQRKSLTLIRWADRCSKDYFN